jgi:hypothetical protein
MLPLTIVAETPEERGALLAGGMVYGGVGGGIGSVAKTGKNAVANFGRSFSARTPPRCRNRRVPRSRPTA